MVTRLQGWRGLICAIALATTLPAQFSPGRFSYAANLPALRAYLSLTDAQAAALDSVSKLFSAESDSRSKRREALETEIFAETARSPLRPEELGRLHAEWEMIRRQSKRGEKNLSQAMRAVLSDSQLVKLNVFDEVMARQSVANELNYSGLSPMDCTAPRYGLVPEACIETLIPAVNKIPEWTSRAEDYDGNLEEGVLRYNARLVKYLELTSAQFDRFGENWLKYGSEDAVKREITVTGEILEERSREIVDPLALGLRFAELESLRRQRSQNLRDLVAANRALLSTAQRTKLDVLEEAFRLGATVDSARRVRILGSRCTLDLYAFYGSAPVNYAGPSVYLGDCPDRRALDEAQ